MKKKTAEMEAITTSCYKKVNIKRRFQDHKTKMRVVHHLPSKKVVASTDLIKIRKNWERKCPLSSKRKSSVIGFRKIEA